jgi:uncharacterized protein YcfL
MKNAFTLFSSTFFLLLGGCVATSSSTTVEKSGSEYKVTVNSLVLDNHIRVTERSASRPDGLLKAQVRGKNMKAKDIQFEYRFIWLDADGMRIDTGMSIWKPLLLSGKEDAFMVGIAPTPQAVDFLLGVRFLQSSTRWQGEE